MIDVAQGSLNPRCVPPLGDGALRAPVLVMRLLPGLVASVSVLAGIMATTTPARADLVNAPCTPSKEKPYPVVLVHGQAGDVSGMTGVIDRLTAEGFCVYGANYGLVPNGANGQAHLWDSAAQVGGFIDWVLDLTHAQKVNVVGHSAGTGVLDNYIMQKGGAAKVHNFVSFGGLHHPYFHIGATGIFDLTIHLPNLIAFGQLFFPGLTIDMITNVLGGMVGDPGLKATITSPFAKDLFDANYWNTLHGGPSEPRGTFLKLGGTRTLPTHDSVPGICNTNIIALGDMLVNDATGWQDANPNVTNFETMTVVTGNTHNDQLGNEDALNKMVEGMGRDCGNAAVGTRSVAPLSLNPLDNPASGAPTEADRVQQQAVWGEKFLRAVNDQYGSQLERSDKPFPWEPGGGGEDDDSSTASASACSVGNSSHAHGTTAIAFGALGLLFAVRARRRKN